MLNGDDHPVGVIETVEVRILRLDEVDASFAFDGGEGDRTLASWREGYGRYIVSECARLGREPTGSVPLVCERFRVVYRESLE